MDRKLLERLYYDGIMPRERCCPRKKDYHDTMQLCDTVEQEFISLLSKEQKSMFQDYKEYATRLTTIHSGDYNIVMSHIRHIREKIEDDPAHPVYIQTVWGVGYKFNGRAGSE